jgi:two-component system OmpR family sensor kinase
MVHIQLRSLRTRLFAAVAVIVVMSVGVTFLVGLVLTRSAVERANLDDLSHQADLLAERERSQLLPLAHLSTLQPFLAKQREQVQVVPLSRESAVLSEARRASLRRAKPVKGHVTLDGSRYLFAAQNVEGKGFVLLRPAKLRSAEVSPFLKGLLIASLVGAALAALASFLLARAISGPVRRVAEAARSLAGGRAPEPLAAEGSTELAQLALAFNEMAEQLQRAREAERTFLLSVSHELKTPLTAIRGYAEGLAEGAVTVEEAAETIRREASRLERLVRDLLDLARLNQHEFTVESGPIDLAEVAREAVARYEPDARAAAVELEAVVAENAAAQGDHDRALQVVSNLVENALRSTPPGGTIRVRAEPGLIAVEDTGVGLPPEDLPRAFERFYLYERNRAGGRLGSGLGLAIVKELTEAMGGSVEVRSTVGEGTTFVVRLPAARSPSQAAEPVTAR